ncbi:MAG: hypothetical protein JW863_22530, partial [Chitinispirillaceae bacterium]|nr:hypothetical protein [Chitinispirillaceae bacterium]
VTLEEPTNDDTLIGTALYSLVAASCKRVRAMGLAVGMLRIGIRYADGAHAARSIPVRPPLGGDLSLYERCSLLLRKIITRRVRLTELSLTCTDLTFPYGQIDLFARTEREEQLMSALDTIRGSYGGKAIRFWGRERVA